jgi:hypothetical protein
MSTVYSPIPELNQLKDFADATGDGHSYANGFQLMEFNTPDVFSYLADDSPELAAAFADRLIIFATANGTGSMYALWRVDDRGSLATLPVVVLGDEGGMFLVARNLLELFQLLALDVEVVPGFTDAGYVGGPAGSGGAGSPRHDAYVAWLDRTFGLAAPDDPDLVVATAEGEYKEAFTAWKAELGLDEDD